MPAFLRFDWLAFVLAGCLLAGPTASAQDAARGYRFSPVNQYGINLTAEYWHPIINYVSQKSGLKLHLKIGRTSADTTAFVLASEAEIVFTNHLFSPERAQLGWKVVGRRQTPPVRGQLVVLADSPITDLAQLRGQDVSFAGPEALIIYKMPYAFLLGKGIDVHVVFGGNQDAALAQLVSGKVKAAGANSQLLEGYAKRERQKFRVLWSTEALYDLALMISPRVPEKDAAAITAAFVGMSSDPVGRDILERASKLVQLDAMAGFVASNGSEYGAYRTFYQTAPPALR